MSQLGNESDYIMHITTDDEWIQALCGETHFYRSPTLVSEGFIHSSTKDQVIDSANRWFKDVNAPLRVLVIDKARLTSPVKIENSFPHVYGPINIDAVVRTIELERSDDGTFKLKEKK